MYHFLINCVHSHRNLLLSKSTLLETLCSVLHSAQDDRTSRTLVRIFQLIISENVHFESCSYFHAGSLTVVLGTLAGILLKIRGIKSKKLFNLHEKGELRLRLTSLRFKGNMNQVCSFSIMARHGIPIVDQDTINILILFPLARFTVLDAMHRRILQTLQASKVILFRMCIATFAIT